MHTKTNKQDKQPTKNIQIEIKQKKPKQKEHKRSKKTPPKITKGKSWGVSLVNYYNNLTNLFNIMNAI